MTRDAAGLALALGDRDGCTEAAELGSRSQTCRPATHHEHVDPYDGWHAKPSHSSPDLPLVADANSQTVAAQ